MLVTAASLRAFEQGLNMIRRGGTMTLIGLIHQSLKLDIFDTVMNAITIRGSVVGTRQDLAEAIELASNGRVSATVHLEKLENINSVLDRLRKGEVEGRIVLDMGASRKVFRDHIPTPFPFA